MNSENKVEIIDCICCWYDLLGFGSPFVQAKWDLHQSVCSENIKRIQNLDFALSHMPHLWKSLLMNDGVIKVHDILPNDADCSLHLIYALTSIVMDYECINQIDSRSYPGLRGVVTYGHRFDYLHGNTDYLINTKQDVVYHPKEFQMNTAFSKAYIIEGSGSKKGIKGNKLYFDKLLIDMTKQILEANSEFVFEESITEEKYACKISNKDRYLLKLFFNPKPVHYDYMGIETDLFSLISYNSHIDDDLRESEYLRAKSISEMEEDL